MQSYPEEADRMKITVQIDGEEVTSARATRSVAPSQILEKTAVLGADDAGPAPASIAGTGPSIRSISGEMRQTAFPKEMATDCGEAPKEFQSKAVSGWQTETSSTELIEDKDAGKAAQQ